MSTLYAEGTTVYGGEAKRKDTREDFLAYKESSSLKPATQPEQKVESFVDANYTLQDRPFFVVIGKGGVLAALEKLDQQLTQVCVERGVVCIPRLLTTIPIGWAH